jgi:hypothetical protein
MQRSLSASDASKKILSPERQLILRAVCTKKALSVQIRFNGHVAMEMIETLVAMVSKLPDEDAHLKIDNVELKKQTSDLKGIAVGTPAPSTSGRNKKFNISVPGPSVHTIRPSPSAQGPCTSDKEVLPPNTAESAVYPASESPDSVTKSYNDALPAGLKPSISGAISDGFTTVTYKKKPAPATIPVNAIKLRRQPLTGVRNSANLQIVSRKERSKALFVSSFSPEVSASDIENSLKQQISLKMLVCTRLKTKFNSYSLFHVSFNEEDFPLINNTGICSSGCLIAPF